LSVVIAPADGTVLTSNPSLLLDVYVGSGQALLELADAGPRIARVFIPSSALNRIPPGAKVALMLPGHFDTLRMTLPAPDSESVSLPDGLVAHQKYQGIKLPVFYCSRIPLPAASGYHPMFGLAGKAKIFGVQRSLAERGFLLIAELVKAHVW
jgi:hypothetical protein